MNTIKSKKDMKKICPLMSRPVVVTYDPLTEHVFLWNEYCQKENCALWCENDQSCALITLISVIEAK